jgi:hypothetical protein
LKERRDSPAVAATAVSWTVDIGEEEAVENSLSDDEENEEERTEASTLSVRQRHMNNKKEELTLLTRGRSQWVRARTS